MKSNLRLIAVPALIINSMLAGVGMAQAGNSVEFDNHSQEQFEPQQPDTDSDLYTYELVADKNGRRGGR